jgi:hypothetical protein
MSQQIVRGSGRGPGDRCGLQGAPKSLGSDDVDGNLRFYPQYSYACTSVVSPL